MCSQCTARNMQPKSDWVSMAAENPNLVTYQLTIELPQERIISIGRLGQFIFPAGNYLYTGSARRHLVSRVKRHLSKDKKLHWHIDYLLAVEGAEVTAVHLSEKTECECNRAVKGIVLAAGFGSSDCKEKCGSHLKYLRVDK